MPPRRGEVWLFDLGMTAKTRPVLVVSVEYGDVDRAIVTASAAHDRDPPEPFRDSNQSVLSPTRRIPCPGRFY